MREIGSDFHFSFQSLSLSRRHKGNNFRDRNTIFLGSGRDALHWIIQKVRIAAGSEVLLPAYLCEDVVKPFADNGLRIRFYKITRALQVDTKDLSNKLSPETRVLLYIHYFGFPVCLPAALIQAGGVGLIVIEDSSHAFLSCLERNPVRGHIRFASYRKLLPIPNGAAVSWRDGWLPGNPGPKTRLSMNYLGAVSCRCLGAALKGLWLQYPGAFPKRLFLQLFLWSEKLIDVYPKPAGMSFISDFLLDRLDVEEIVQTRRRNFQHLLAGLEIREGLYPLYRSLPEGVCPLGLPILVDDRDGLARHLIRNSVYAPIHWELPKLVDREEFEEAWFISDHILTIPIDQRYNDKDMARILALINSYERATP